MDFSAVNSVLAKRKTEDEINRAENLRKSEVAAQMLKGDTVPARISVTGVVEPPPSLQPALPEPLTPVPLMPTPQPVMPRQLSETSTTTSGILATPGLRNAIAGVANAGVAQKAAAQQMGQSQSMAADTESKTLAEIGAKEIELAGQEKIEREAMQAKKEQRLNAYQQDLSKFQNQKYEGFWQGRGTGEKIAAALAIAFGAVGSALQGRAGNTALEIINDTIDDDYKRYENKVAQQLRGLEQSRIAEADKTELEEKSLIGAAAYRTAQLQQVKNKLLVQSAGAKSQAARDNAAMMAAQIDAQIAASNVEMQSLLAPRSQTTTQTKDVIADPNKRYDTQDAIRKSVDADAQIQRARQAKAAGNALLKITGDDTTADASRLQAFVKTADPTSVVSMNEMKGALANVGIKGMVDEKLNWIKGSVMTPEQRKALERITLDRMDAAFEEAKPVYQYYDKLSRDRGFTPQDTITDYGFYERAAKPTAAPTAMTMEQKAARMRDLEKRSAP